jgi:hypothetical protein
MLLGSRAKSRSRSLRLGSTTATMVLALLVVAIGAPGSGAEQARHSSGPSSAGAQYGKNVTLCYKGHTTQVDSKSVDAFIAQGATRGACKSGVAGTAVTQKTAPFKPPTPATTTTTTTAPTTTTTTTSSTPTFVAHVAPKTTG